MLLNDPFEDFLGAGMIPHPIRPDDRYRSSDADLQTIGLGPLDAAPSRYAELLQSALEKLPCTLADLAAAALLLFRQRADEDMALDRFAADLGQRRFGLRQILRRGVRRGCGYAQPFLPAIRAISA